MQIFILKSQELLCYLVDIKVDFRAKKIAKNKEGLYIVIKGLFHQEEIVILNVYSPNNRDSKYIRQKLIELKGETDKSTIIVRDFKTSLSPIHRITGEKISKGTEELNNTINPQDRSHLSVKLRLLSKSPFFSCFQRITRFFQFMWAES